MSGRRSPNRQQLTRITLTQCADTRVWIIGVTTVPQIRGKLPSGLLA